jgi:hypothetical protein
MKISKELEKDILDWHKSVFNDATLESQIAKMEEEVDEVLNAENCQEFYKELSDCWIVAYALQRWSLSAFRFAVIGLDYLEKESNWEIPKESFERMIADKLEINKKRKWKKINNVYHHI